MHLSFFITLRYISTSFSFLHCCSQTSGHKTVLEPLSEPCLQYTFILAAVVARLNITRFLNKLGSEVLSRTHTPRTHEEIKILSHSHHYTHIPIPHREKKKHLICCESIFTFCFKVWKVFKAPKCEAGTKEQLAGTLPAAMPACNPIF